jgi:uncharacterized protein DUF5906
MTSTPPPFRGFCIANLAEHKILTQFNEFWLTAPAVPTFPDREAYKTWMKDPHSTVPLFSLLEGSNPAHRVSASNPAYKVWGIVAEYDCELVTSDVATGLTRVPTEYPVFAWNRTRRGGLRMVWRFESPIFFYGPDTFKRLMARAKKELHLSNLFPGLDTTILASPDQCYTAGDHWTHRADACLKNETVALWLFDICLKSKDFDRAGIEIPLDVVEAEVHKRFPNRWSGDFTEGSRGIRFYDPIADNATAAIVRSTGMTCFTGGQPFMSWADIFGLQFVKQFQEDRIGNAATEMYTDKERNYYHKLPDGQWNGCGIEITKRHIKGLYGLTDHTRKGEVLSDVESVLYYLDRNRRVEGALPFPLNPQSVVNWNGQTFLNVATARLILPVDTDQEWAVNFPWLAGYFEKLFIDQANLNVFLAWLKVWYASVLAGSPCRGQALFVVGPPGTGKTFLSRAVVGRIFGGYADAHQYFVDGGRFNSSLFDKALWCLDDSTILAEHKALQKFSSLIKAAVANDSFPYEKKYGYSGAVPFNGRLLCTLNDDPISYGILPDTDHSLLDKVTMLRTGNVIPTMAALAKDRYSTLDQELPYFLKWLICMPLPSEVKPDTRFGIESWHDREVLEEARSGSYSSAVMEIVDLWRSAYVVNMDLDDGQTDTKAKTWEGTAAQLMQKLHAINSIKPLITKLTPMSLGRQISAAINAGCPYLARYLSKAKTRDRLIGISLT